MNKTNIKISHGVLVFYVDGEISRDLNGQFQSESLMKKLKFLLLQKKYSYDFETILLYLIRNQIKLAVCMADRLQQNEKHLLFDTKLIMHLLNTRFKQKLCPKNTYQNIQQLQSSIKQTKQICKQKSGIFLDIPKGRSDNNETSIQCAVRELQEEIQGIKISDLCFDNKKMIQIHVGSDNKQYQYIIYPAVLKQIGPIDIQNINTKEKDRYNKAFFVSVDQLQNQDAADHGNFCIIQLITQYVKNILDA